ncbi:DEAD/DEAH box helicase [Modestobacter sp. VKM Ac-2984]|uniref:DEAD/DEAH box helicase n=1 Tax=Modestobacter sp. VKM Ac-2984 TaxID=3004138 RepID=UPI0022AAEE1F|nr:helicase-related protein [Modestobacter sp. VKM Ac-2984]MCZ2817914.1 helicase-related protein [Modestobacter sp. VKM Ac-2984]
MVVSRGAPPGESQRVDTGVLPDAHPLRDAEGWMHHFWPDGVDVSAPRFRINDDVMVLSSGRDHPVRSRRFSAGRWLYDLRVDGRQVTFGEDMLAELQSSDTVHDWIKQSPDTARRLSATLTREKLAGAFTDTLFSFRATRTLFRAYQFRPVIRMLESGKSRILIADEVGLGKTIEAGLVWTELEARKSADRVLVVCPAALVAKWRREMEDRFGFQLVELSGPAASDFEQRARENRLPRRFSYVVSLERFRTWESIEELATLAGPLSLAIVDEAHNMRNASTASHQAGALLSEWAEALVLLTATPINLRNEDLYNLLDLLAPGDFGGIGSMELQLEPNVVLNQVGGLLSSPAVDGGTRLKVLDGMRSLAMGRPLVRRREFAALREVVGRDVLSPREIVQARRHLAELNVLSSVFTRTRRVEVDEKKAVRQAMDTEVHWTAGEQRFYDEYVTWCRNRAAAAGQPPGFAMQMPLRLASACLPAARAAVLRWSVEDDDLADEDSTGSPTTARPPLLRPHAELLHAADAIADVDSKFDAIAPKLLDVIRRGRRALLFTFSRPTLAYLERRLQGHCRVAVLHGGVDRDRRNEVMADFRAGRYELVLANKVASEGLDFEFCSVIVNYDLPWNPMEVEQRIGRIDRIGQAEEVISILNVWCPAALDDRIKQRLLSRIGVFEGSIGALEPIVTNHLRALQDVVFDFDLSDKQRATKADHALSAMEEQRSSLEDLATATPFLLGASTTDVAGLERDLVASGRYVGAAELQHVLEDWAALCQAPAPALADGGVALRLRGNRDMADRLHRLVVEERLSREEAAPYERALRNEEELHLVLDQETARTSQTMDLLSARHPLVLAAANLPEHRRARFAVVRVTDQGQLEPGTYVIQLAVARWEAPRAGQEIWGTAVGADGRPAGDQYVDVLLARLATGELQEGRRPVPALLERCVDLLQELMDDRMLRENQRRRSEISSLIESRRVLLEDQHERARASIQARRRTAFERGKSRGVKLFDSQLARREEAHRQTLSELDQTGAPDVSLSPLAVCVLEVGE